MGTPFCYACGVQGGGVGERCGRDLAAELDLSPALCRGYIGLPLGYGQARARASVETNIYGHGDRWRWKYVDALGRSVTSQAMVYPQARAEMLAWQRARAQVLTGQKEAA
jgi:hypothetical protein